MSKDFNKILASLERATLKPMPVNNQRFCEHLNALQSAARYASDCIAYVIQVRSNI